MIQRKTQREYKPTNCRTQAITLGGEQFSLFTHSQRHPDPVQQYKENLKLFQAMTSIYMRRRICGFHPTNDGGEGFFWGGNTFY